MSKWVCKKCGKDVVGLVFGNSFHFDRNGNPFVNSEDVSFYACEERLCLGGVVRIIEDIELIAEWKEDEPKDAGDIYER